MKSGDSLVIFPEGRLTVTGSLMKVYDGAGLIADKSGAMVVPVRIEGPEATISRGSTQIRCARRWFPKFTLTVLEPASARRRRRAEGKARRQAAGVALYQIMSDLMFRTTDADAHAVRRGRRTPRANMDCPASPSKTRLAASSAIANC